MKKDNLKQQYRINEQIRVREVRIVGDDVESTVMPTAKALQMAEAQGVDLVEISPNAVPPVCRLIGQTGEGRRKGNPLRSPDGRS